MNRKKITSLIAIVLLSTIGFFGTSCCRCTDNDFFETSWQPRTFQIESIDWRLSGCQTYWFVDRPFRELTNFVINEGAVLGYLILHNGSRVPLPDTWTEVILLDDGSEFIFSETYTFQISPGQVRFTYQTSDAFIGQRPPARRFHIVLIW